MKHRADQKWAKRVIRYLEEDAALGRTRTLSVPEALERYRYYYGATRKPDYYQDVEAKIPIMKRIDKRKFEPREEVDQCSKVLPDRQKLCDRDNGRDTTGKSGRPSHKQEITLANKRWLS